jgi:hypothetical protein
LISVGGYEPSERRKSREIRWPSGELLDIHDPTLVAMMGFVAVSMVDVHRLSWRQLALH